MPTAACACTSLRKATRAVSRLYDEALAADGITTCQFAILRALQRGGATPLSRLAEQMVMDRTSLYRALAPIETRGLVAIVPGPGRSRVAGLTEAGRAAIAASDATWDGVQTRFTDALGPEEWTMLEALLGKAMRVAGEMAA